MFQFVKQIPEFICMNGFNVCFKFNMGSKQYGVDHLNMEINKFTVERKVYHRLNQSQFRISILVFFRVNFTGY